MKKVLVSYAILLLGSCTVGVDQESVDEKQIPDATIKITDSIVDDLFSIKIPEGWQKISNKPRNMNYLIMKSNKNSGLWNNLSISTGTPKIYKIGFFKNLYEELVNLRKGEMEIFSEDSGKFSHGIYYRVEYSTYALGNDYRNIDVYFLKNSGTETILLSSSTPVAFFEIVQPEIEYIISSIVIK